MALLSQLLSKQQVTWPLPSFCWWSFDISVSISTQYRHYNDDTHTVWRYIKYHGSGKYGRTNVNNYTSHVTSFRITTSEASISFILFKVTYRYYLYVQVSDSRMKVVINGLQQSSKAPVYRADVNKDGGY